MDGNHNGTVGLFPAQTTTESLASSPTLYTYPELVFCAVGFSTLIVLSIGGNVLVLVAVARTKKLQNVTNVFVVNLSVSDCLSGVAFLWSLPGMVSTTPGYPVSQPDFLCAFWAAVVYLGIGSGLYTLASIALNRCILVTRPTEYRWLYTPKKTALMVIVSWLIPLCATIIPPLCGTGALGFDLDSRTCTDLETHPNSLMFDRILFSVYYPLPLVVIVTSYVLIWRHIRRHFKTVRRSVRQRMQTSTPMPSTTTLNMDIEDSCPRTPPAVPRLRHAESSRQLTRTKNDQLEITKNLFVVVLAFVACFTPLGVMVLIKSDRYQLYAGMVLFLSGCINPVIYATKHPHFRPVLIAMLRRRCRTE